MRGSANSAPPVSLRDQRRWHSGAAVGTVRSIRLCCTRGIWTLLGAGWIAHPLLARALLTKRGGADRDASRWFRTAADHERPEWDKRPDLVSRWDAYRVLQCAPGPRRRPRTSTGVQARG